MHYIHLHWNFQGTFQTSKIFFDLEVFEIYQGSVSSLLRLDTNNEILYASNHPRSHSLAMDPSFIYGIFCWTRAK